MKQDSQKSSSLFANLGLSSDFVQVLDRLNFKTPTPIQEKSIPETLHGKDVIGIAQTGTGKTLAFCLPMLEKIRKEGGSGLIVVPTRELAAQVSEEIEKVGGRLGFKTTLLVGGADIGQQIRSLRRGPHVIVATPGRLNDHLERRTADLSHVHTLVLDEADRMLDMGFAPQINQILQSVPNDRQTLLFSATIPEGVAKIAQGYMNNPITIKVVPTGTDAKSIKQGMYYVDASSKFPLLQELLERYENGPVLVFCRTKHATKKMARILNTQGHVTEELHSNRTLSQRRRALQNFKSGKSRILVATDVAARGIDVKEIELVVNYDIPDQNEDYIHRIGRTGRAGHTGCALSFVSPDQYRDMKAIERLVGISIPVLEASCTLTAKDMERYAYSGSKPSSHGQGGRGGRNQSRGRRSSSQQRSTDRTPAYQTVRAGESQNENRAGRPKRRSGKSGAYQPEFARGRRPGSARQSKKG